MITNKELDDWLKHIDRNRWEEIAELLEEIREYRQSDLRPATKFLHQLIHCLISKVCEECDEVINEYHNDFDDAPGNYDFSKLTEELCDLQMACETVLTKLGLDEQQRREMRKQVIAKNEARNYYEEAK